MKKKWLKRELASCERDVEDLSRSLANSCLDVERLRSQLDACDADRTRLTAKVNCAVCRPGDR